MSRSKLTKIVALGAAGLMLAQASSAFAAVAIYNLSITDPAAGLGSGPFGTVTVTEVAGGTLSIVETLAPGVRIHDGNSNHNALTFSILGDPAVTISGLTAGFTAFNTSAGTNVAGPPFGSYFTGIDCSSACGPGYAGGFAGPLSFTVSSASSLSLASLGFNTYNGNNIYFASDLVISNGSTGNVGAVRSTPAVPEPATWLMMILGFAGIGLTMRKRNGAPQARVRFG